VNLLFKRNDCVDSDRRFASETPSADPDTKAPSAINAPGFASILPTLLNVIAHSAVSLPSSDSARSTPM